MWRAVLRGRAPPFPLRMSHAPLPLCGPCPCLWIVSLMTSIPLPHLAKSITEKISSFISLRAIDLSCQMKFYCLRYSIDLDDAIPQTSFPGFLNITAVSNRQTAGESHISHSNRDYGKQRLKATVIEGIYMASQLPSWQDQPACKPDDLSWGKSEDRNRDKTKTETRTEGIGHLAQDHVYRLIK